MLAPALQHKDKEKAHNSKKKQKDYTPYCIRISQERCNAVRPVHLLICSNMPQNFWKHTALQAHHCNNRRKEMQLR